jgi:hypothetical protein
VHHLRGQQRSKHSHQLHSTRPAGQQQQQQQVQQLYSVSHLFNSVLFVLQFRTDVLLQI